MALADSLLRAVRALEVDASEAQDVLGSDQGSLARFREIPARSPGCEAVSNRWRHWFSGTFSAPHSSGSQRTRSWGARDAWGSGSRPGASPELASGVGKVEATVEALDAVMSRVAAIVERLERGEGTAGRALVDGEIRRQLEALRTAAAELAEDLGYNRRAG